MYDALQKRNCVKLILKNMKRAWQIGNILSLLFALVANFLVGAQLLNLPAIGQISDKYTTLLTPAGYAFSIWSLIYLLLIVFIVYQARDILKPRKQNTLPQAIGPFFIISSLGNGIWTYLFVKEYIGLSVIVILLLTASLYAILAKLRIATYSAPFSTIAFVWWPLLIYTGWVSVASIVNIASWLESLEVAVSPIIASAILVGLLAILIMLLIKRNVRELLLASAWGIIAIGMQQVGMVNGNRLVATTAFGVGGMLIVAASVHAYKNRHASILVKLRH